MRAHRVLRVVAGAAFLSIALVACSTPNASLTNQYGAGTTKNYINGDGTVTEIARKDRTAPVEFTGTLDSGQTISRSHYRGRVMVLNFWYAACPPCRKEAPYLENLSRTYQPKGVQFLGVNVRDQADTSRAFERSFHITYPSVVDANNATVQLALAGTIAPNAVPTTIILDKDGRVAARILGGIPGPGILDALISTALAETK